MELHGDRVTLREATLDDAETMLAIMLSPAVVPWWQNYTLDKCREDLAYPDDHSFVVLVGDEVVGHIQYSEELEPDYRHAEIDIALHGDHVGRGLGSDAIRTLARFLFDERHHHRIVIGPAVANTAAIRSYEKVGFRPVGIERQAERGPDGTWHDTLLLDMLAGELI